MKTSNYLIFNLPSNPLSNDAYFIRYGNLVPNATEYDQINNPSSINRITSPDYNNWIMNYPFKDDNYANKTTTSPATLSLSSNSAEATIELNGWYKFDLNQSSSFSIVLQAPLGVYTLTTAQYYGHTSVSINSDNQSVYAPFTNIGPTASIRFFSTYSKNTKLIHIGIYSISDSEIYLKVNDLSGSQSKLYFNQVVQGKHDYKQSDSVQSNDPFRQITNTKIKRYQFAVPDSMDGKLL